MFQLPVSSVVFTVSELIEAESTRRVGRSAWRRLMAEVTIKMIKPVRKPAIKEAMSLPMKDIVGLKGIGLKVMLFSVLTVMLSLPSISLSIYR